MSSCVSVSMTHANDAYYRILDCLALRFMLFRWDKSCRHQLLPQKRRIRCQAETTITESSVVNTHWPRLCLHPHLRQPMSSQRCSLETGHRSVMITWCWWSLGVEYQLRRCQPRRQTGRWKHCRLDCWHVATPGDYSPNRHRASLLHAKFYLLNYFILFL